MKNKLSKLWIYLSGKKTVAGILLHAGWFAAHMIKGDQISEQQIALGHGIIFQITGVGLTHKWFKNNMWRKVVSIFKRR